MATISNMRSIGVSPRSRVIGRADAAASTGLLATVGRVITVQRTVVCDRPVEPVFAYLRDFEHAVEWDVGTVACRRLEGDGGVGTTYVCRSRVFGRETELVYRVDDLVPDERIVFAGGNGSLASSARLEIVQRPGGSEVVYTKTYKFKGAARLAEPLMSIRLRRLGDEAERTLTGALSRL
jgi:uncharacterized protein YndB with AHSA1/START domain